MHPTIVKAQQPFDFLALVPQLVGFRPENSVVLVAFRGNRTCGALRFGLPDATADTRVHKRIATTIVGMLCKIPGVDAVVPVVYTDDRFADAGAPHAAFARTLVQRSQMSGFLVRDALCVGANGWGSYDDPELPPGGRPLDDIARSAVHAELPESGHGHQGVAAMAELPRVDPAARERVARSLRRYRRAAESADASPELVSMVGDVLDPIAMAEAALTWDASAPSVPDAAALLFVVQGPANRDQVMLQFAFGEPVGREVFAVNLRYAMLQRATGLSLDDIVAAELDGAGTDADSDGARGGLAQTASGLLMGTTAERPDPERVERAIAVLKTLVALAPRPATPAPLCMLAWLSWALGRGSVAGLFIDKALRVDPGYGMALLLDTLLGTGHLPEWAFAVPTDDRMP